MTTAKRWINGTYGEVWLNGEQIAECYGLQAKMSFDKEEMAQAGELAVDYKVKSMKGTGSLKLHKATSRMAKAVGDDIMAGKDPRFTLITSLDDPDAYGAERVCLSNVSFDDLTLADWERAVLGNVECPFTFTKYKYMDRIEEG